MALPYQTTKIAVTRSVEQIKKLLYGVGFNSFGEELKPDGNIEIVAAIQKDNNPKIEFYFTVNYKQIPDLTNAYIDDARAKRIAWRCLYFQVKSLADSIKLGVISMPEAFAGNISICDKSGTRVKIGTVFTELALENNFNMNALNQKLLAE
jgi:hypothetical protein